MTASTRGTALVTGAGRRIGRTIAEALAGLGYSVAIHFQRSRADAEAVAHAIVAAGGRAAVLAADLGREAETRTLVARAAAALGPLTCLVNNASVFDADSIASATRESWDAHMEVNLRAPFVLMQDFAAQLPHDATGNVINLLDERVWNPTPYFVSYTVSKIGLWTLTQTLALALAPRVRVNAIGPGPTLPSARQSLAQFERQWAAMPLKRGTTPDEIAAAVRFILDSPAMTGQMIALDGGRHLGWAHPGATVEVYDE
ncbi:MAG: SDR family oxidoreductase [Alphaproteobacteria bacterium]|nr:SDR family oxidoreductase [Alphaproteobacteria bacterium]